jgi:hypothetical protein
MPVHMYFASDIARVAKLLASKAVCETRIRRVNHVVLPDHGIESRVCWIHTSVNRLPKRIVGAGKRRVGYYAIEIVALCQRVTIHLMSIVKFFDLARSHSAWKLLCQEGCDEIEKKQARIFEGKATYRLWQWVTTEESLRGKHSRDSLGDSLIGKNHAFGNGIMEFDVFLCRTEYSSRIQHMVKMCLKVPEPLT